MEVSVLEGPTIDDEGWHLQARCHRPEVAVETDTFEVTGILSFNRPSHEIWIFVGIEGAVSEGRRRISPGDALVLEGDDPSRIELVNDGRPDATLARIRFRRRNGVDLRWVP